MSDSSATDEKQAAVLSEVEATVRRMTKVGSCSGPSFAPDGRWVAFISNLSGLPQAWTVPVEGGWPRPVTALDDPVQSVSWSPDGEWLALAVAPGGGMNGQIYLARPDGSNLHRITQGGRENSFLGPWTHDGRFLAFGSNRRRANAVDAFFYEVATGETRLVAENPGRGTINDVSRDLKHAILSRVAHRSDSNLFLLDLEQGSSGETLLTPHDGPGTFSQGRFSPDGRSVYLISNKDRDLTAFSRIRLGDDGAPGPIEVLAERDGAELDSFALSEDGATAALVWSEAGRGQLVYLDLATLRETPGPELPGEVIAGVSFSRAGDLLTLTLTGSNRPMDVWTLERSSGRLSQITHSPHAGVDLDRLARPELVRFPAHDGLELSGWLYRPEGVSGPGPVVLSFHGGPEGQSRPIFSPVFQALLAQGIAVFVPNVRGSSGFGKRFVNLDNGALRWDAIKDIASCVQFVVDAGIADPKRIGITGGSYGGYMTMAGLGFYPELFAAGANLYGVVNFETFFAHTEPWMAAISKVEYGDPDSEAEMLRELSPITAIDRVVAPTLVIHGANDTNVPVVEAEQVVERLRARGVPVEYILFPDEGHGFRKLPNRIRADIAVASWFARYL